MNKEIKAIVSNYYTSKIKKFGATANGVDWNGEESQFQRFFQLSHVLGKEPFSILDYGCGYGAYFTFLQSAYQHFQYFGFDISEEMILTAKDEHKASSQEFFSSTQKLEEKDYVIASGLFNVRDKIEDTKWLSYIKEELVQFHKLSKKGFAFNALTSYSDKEYKKDYLYYADPLLLFDFCKQNFSRNVALLHDYDLYEFTILVKK